MALQIPFTTKDGQSGNYVNVVPYFRDKTTVGLRLRFFTDKATRDAKPQGYCYATLPFVPDGYCGALKGNYSFAYDLGAAANLYAQAYTYLKTLPEFAGAADC